MNFMIALWIIRFISNQLDATFYLKVFVFKREYIYIRPKKRENRYTFVNDQLCKIPMDYNKTLIPKFQFSKLNLILQWLIFLNLIFIVTFCDLNSDILIC